MNDLILITVSAIGGGIVGFLGMAWLTVGKVDDIQSAEILIRDLGEEIEIVTYAAESWAKRAGECEAAHTRCADALAAKSDRIDRALECVTENSAHVGKKMAAILKGER